MTYNVFGGTLNPTLLLVCLSVRTIRPKRLKPKSPTLAQG